MPDILTDAVNLRAFAAELLLMLEDWSQYEGGPDEDELATLRERARKMGVSI